MEATVSSNAETSYIYHLIIDTMQGTVSSNAETS